MDVIKSRRVIPLLVLAALLLTAAAFCQRYLKDNLVVAAEGHEHAHSHEEGEAAHEEEGEGDEGQAEKPPGNNLITNFSFEVGESLDIYGWSPVGFDPGTSAWRDTLSAADGFACAALSADESSSGYDLLWRQQVVEFPTGVDLEVSGLVRVEELSGRSFLRVSGIRIYGGEARQTVFLDLSGPSGSGGWDRLSGELYLPEDIEFLVVEVGIFGFGKAWFDEISAVPRERLHSPPPYEVNLLRNPDFQEGLSGWGLLPTDPLVRSGWGISDDGPGGGKALFIQPVAPAAEPNPTFFYQAVSGLEGSPGVAHLSGSANTLSLQGEANVFLVLYTSDAYYTVTPTEPLTGGNGWRRLSCSAPLPEGIRSAWIYLSAEGSGTALFSEIDFHISPASP